MRILGVGGVVFALIEDVLSFFGVMLGFLWVRGGGADSLLMAGMMLSCAEVGLIERSLIRTGGILLVSVLPE